MQKSAEVEREHARAGKDSSHLPHGDGWRAKQRRRVGDAPLVRHACGQRDPLCLESFPARGGPSARSFAVVGVDRGTEAAQKRQAFSLLLCSCWVDNVAEAAENRCRIRQLWLI